MPTKEVSTRLALPAGRYTVEIRLADEAAGDCGGATAIGPASILFDSGENASVIAHLGEDGGLTASKYSNDLMPAGDDDHARVAVHHDAAVGAVDIRLLSVYGDHRFKPAVELKGAVNPESAEADVKAGLYLAMISAPRKLPIAYRYIVLPAGESTLLLHTDASVMPRSRRAWASWNYLVPSEVQDGVFVTYHMNRLQGLEVGQDLLVTLNGSRHVDPRHVIDSFVYHHPVFDTRALCAQRNRDVIDGVRGTHYCGAWWGYGFHEDGVRSAMDVGRALGVEL